jgi:hypothetical protein
MIMEIFKLVRKRSGFFASFAFHHEKKHHDQLSPSDKHSANLILIKWG